MVALNAIVNAKYNKCLLVVVGNAFCFLSSLLASAVYWSYVWSRLLLFDLCSLIVSSSTCTTLCNFVTGFCWVFLF